jgi:cytochrome c2
MASSMKVFLLILSGFFLWYSELLLINPNIVMAQDKGTEKGEALRALVKHMVPESLPPGIAPEKLPEPNSFEAKHLQKYCTQCHDLFSPRMHSAEKWTSVFQRMSWHMQMLPRGRKMGTTINIEVPIPQDETELLTYLKRNSLQVAGQSKLEYLDTPSGMAFLQTCAQCHALPDPKQQSTQEWPDVATRMSHNMEIMHKPLIQPKEIALIVKFLQLAASQ